MAPVSSLMRRLHRNVLLGTLAMLALLQPAMVPFSPDMAGRLPNHGHIYLTGVAVPHSHPGDAVPAHDHGSEDVAPATADAAGRDVAVVFTFEDLGLFASVIAPAVTGAPETPEPVAAHAAPQPMRPATVVVAPRPQPPRI